jgi:hypothetical protein
MTQMDIYMGGEFNLCGRTRRKYLFGLSASSMRCCFGRFVPMVHCLAIWRAGLAWWSSPQACIAVNEHNGDAGPT